MLLQVIPETNNPQSQTTSDECGLNDLSLLFNAGMHGLGTAGQLYIIFLCLHFLAITTSTALSLLRSSSRKYSTKVFPPFGASLANSTTQRGDSDSKNTFTVLPASGGINKRSVDYIRDNPAPMLLINLNQMSLAVGRDGEVYGTKLNFNPDYDKNSIHYRMTQELFINLIRIVRKGQQLQDYNGSEVLVLGHLTKRYICMNHLGNCYSQKMVNRTLTYDCIWRLKIIPAAVVFIHSYYPQPVRYIRNTKTRKQWFLSIDMYGFPRNGNKTKGRRNSCLWRAHHVPKSMNLEDDRRIHEGLMDYYNKQMNSTNFSSRNLSHIHYMKADELQMRHKRLQRDECSKITSLLQEEISSDLRKSKKILNDTWFLREQLIELFKSSYRNFDKKKVRDFRRDFDHWIKLHWWSAYWKFRTKVIKEEIESSTGLTKINNPIRHSHLKKLKRELRRTKKRLRSWQRVKHRIVGIISPLTLSTYLRKKPSRRLHVLIRRLHFHIQSSRNIRWAVYVKTYLRGKNGIIFKFAEVNRQNRLGREGKFMKTPRRPGSKRSKFLQKWHSIMKCTQVYENRLKALRKLDMFRLSS